MRKTINRYKGHPSHAIFDLINTVLMILITLLSIYPMYYIFIYAISDPLEAAKGLTFYPKQVTILNFLAIFQDSEILHAMYISILRTVLGTSITVIFTTLLAYLLSQQKLPGRKFFLRFIIITMYFSAGLIPWYLVMCWYGLKNNFLLYIIPGAINAYYMILIKTYIENLPASLEEAAELDGAGILAVVFRVIIPLSKPILAAVTVFCALGQWNSWTDNMYLVKNQNLKTLQYALYEFFQSKSMSLNNMKDVGLMMSEDRLTTSSLRMAVAVVSIIPIFMVYPVVQKHFQKGIMLGAVKG